jgi:DDE family transposase
MTPSATACATEPATSVAPAATVVQQMRDKLATEAGKATYKRRKCIPEPVFGQIKEGRGFRRFSFRGLAKVAAEWSVVALTHNVLKLFRSGWKIAPKDLVVELISDAVRGS